MSPTWSGTGRAVSEAMARHGIEPRQLMLEITESLLMRDVDKTLHILTELKNMGIRIAIDDFGTGYSSMSYLKDLPVRELKIDRSFVKGLSHEGGDSAIVRAVVTVAKSLNMDVTAEGIETDQQRLELSEHRFQLVARATSDAVFDWNITTGESWRSATKWRAKFSEAITISTISTNSTAAESK